MDKVVEYDPDLIMWFVTLNTLISQRVNPFLIANQERVTKVLELYDISFEGRKLVEKEPDFFEKTLIGQRSNLVRQIKLQMLGIIWTATGVDTNTRLMRMLLLISRSAITLIIKGCNLRKI